MGTVVELRTPEGHESVTLEGDRLTAGRAPGNDLRNPDDPTLSAVHAVFEQVAGVWCVRDLDSANGTFVNGQRVVGGRALADGDELRMGSTHIVFRTDVRRPVTKTTPTHPAPRLSDADRQILAALCAPKLEGSMLDPPAPLEAVAARCGITAGAAEDELRRLAADLGVGGEPLARVAQEAIQSGAVGPADLHDAGRTGFERSGNTWKIAYGGVTFALKEMKGLTYLHLLLSSPGRELFVTELAAAGEGQGEGSPAGAVESEIASGALTTTSGEGGVPALDDKAKAAYRVRVQDLQDVIREGEEYGDDERVARARMEIDSIAEELATAVGLGGRDREMSSKVERTRLNVTRAIRSAIDKIDAFSPPLAQHLRRCVSTGRYCGYTPDEDVHWHL